LGTTPGRELIYKRRLIFGRDTYLIFPAQYYGNVKAIFDAINQREREHHHSPPDGLRQGVQ